VHHFNYCQWRIATGEVADEYSKRMFLNTHHYNDLGFRSSLL